MTINDPANAFGIIYGSVIAFPGDITIEGFHFSPALAGIFLKVVTGNVDIDDCNAEGAVEIGIYLEGVRGNATLTSCSVDGSTLAGIYIKGVTGYASLTNCSADGGIGAGIYVDGLGGDAILSDCSANSAKVYGIYLASVGGIATLTDCLADGAAGAGIYVDGLGGNATLTACSADGAGEGGIVAAGVGGNATLSDCGANNSKSGGVFLVNSGGDLSIQNSIINYNRYGIIMSSLNINKLNIINYNNISKNSECGLFIVNGNYSVDAKNNWWGHDSGPSHPNNPGGNGDAICEDSSFTGSLNFDPWESTPLDIPTPCYILPPPPIPSLNTWGVILLAACMAGSMFCINRRRNKTG